MPRTEELKEEIISAAGNANLLLLDQPIWNALTTEHSAIAIGGELAKRYPAEIGPLSGVAEESDAAYAALRSLTDPGGLAVLFLQSPPAERPGWSLARGGLLTQMVWRGDGLEAAALPAGVEIRLLTPADVSEMTALAKLTEPGPFGRRTIELGDFFGVFEAGRLVAMAGQRTRVPGMTEVSAVCTHPDARGRGYARTLMSEVMAGMLRRGERPILHAFADNYPAIRVYENLGFVQRRTLHLAALKAE